MPPVQRSGPLSPRRVLSTSIAKAVHSSIATLQKIIRLTKPVSISKGIDPEIYKIPRNLDIFPGTLNSIPHSKQAVELPIQYNISQLNMIFRRGRREEDHVGHIFVSSAKYCKQSGNPQHEFLLFEVYDSQIPKIKNYLILDRTTQVPQPHGAAISTSLSTSSTTSDRLLISAYGDQRLLTKQCGLHPHDVLESLDLSSVKSSKQLPLCELIILALNISQSRKMHDLMSAQRFWFCNCVWECMQALVPEIQSIHVAKPGTRGRFLLQTGDRMQIDDILYQTEHEIRQFHEFSRRNQRVDGLETLTNEVERVAALRREMEAMRQDLEKLRAGMD